MGFFNTIGNIVDAYKCSYRKINGSSDPYEFREEIRAEIAKYKDLNRQEIKEKLKNYKTCAEKEALEFLYRSPHTDPKYYTKLIIRS